MRVITDTGSIDLGTTETTPTIGLTDYSVRSTDDFGVTTVVPRGFSRTMTLRSLVPTDQVDALQSTLASLRATTAQWVADERFAWLSVNGYFKDLSIELALPTVSYCSLTIEGLQENEAGADPGGDPAPSGQTSTLRMIQPVAITDAVLTSSNVTEADADEWNSVVSYAAGARVMRVATHRVYESLSIHNAGNVPETSPAVWQDLGPTNRWAMFDQALGTATTSNSAVVVAFTAPAEITGLVVLDTDAGSVQVQAPGYDNTVPRNGDGAVVFTDLAVAAGATITVTINAGGGTSTPRVWNDGGTWSDGQAWQDYNSGAGPGTVSVGTLLFGNLVALGITEASPTTGITDYSLKNTDEFGAVTIVERAWSKTMTAAALIDVTAVDVVASRIAAVRTGPAFWMGQAGLDTLAIYGFFTDFSIEVSETTAKLALTIQGLSKAAQVDPLSIAFDNITGADKPEAGATRNVPRGAWDVNTAYAAGDIVTYQGSSYIAGENVPVGTLPTDTTFWDQLAVGGGDGLPGPAGANGTPSYVHVAYANSADGSTGFVMGIANPGRPYIGIYTDATSAGSSDYHSYNWSKLTGDNGLNGTNGTPGVPGADGRTPYVHFAYADSVDGTTNFTTGDPGTRSYLGVYTDYLVPDSNDPSVYAWSLIKGPQGIPGPPASDGSAAFVHIAYANSADGSTDFVAGVANPGRIYIGIYTDGLSTGSTDYHVYNWSRLTGANGTNGTNGTPGSVGADGRQSYVHFAYADSAGGASNFTTGDPGTRTWIGVYSDYTVPDSTNPADYAWSLIKGSDGAPGPVGPTGAASTVPGPPGPSGTNGTNGVSPSPKYTAFDVAGEGTWTCGYPIPLASGQTLTINTDFTNSFSSTHASPATITSQIQYSLDGGSSWSAVSGGTVSSSVSPVSSGGDLVEFAATGTYTAAGSQTVRIRVVVTRTGNSDAQFGYNHGFGQPS